MDNDKLASDAGALAEFNRQMIAKFRANGGKVDGLPGGELLVLHTAGAKSGQQRLNPLAFLEIDGRVFIVGSNLGSSRNPSWVHNLRATPQAKIDVGTDSFDVTARELSGQERSALFPRLAELAPVLGDYQAGTERTIPVFELIRGEFG